MWNCGFTMSQATAQYERLLLQYMQESRVGELLLAQSPFIFNTEKAQLPETHQPRPSV
jgi:hypothetical protein